LFCCQPVMGMSWISAMWACRLWVTRDIPV